MRLRVLLGGSAVFLAACSVTSTATPAESPMTATQPAASPSLPAPSQSQTTYPADWPLPDLTLSPGAVATTDVTRLCPHVDPALEAARPSSADKAKVYQAYGLTYPQQPGKYELDHIIPIELGGAPNAGVANEYPELNDTPDPAMIAKYHLTPSFIHNSKDIVEDVLHADVCAGKVTLTAAQAAMRTDWRAAYVIYVGPAPGN